MVDRSGNGSAPTTVYPNYAHINRLRERDNLPPLAPKPEHENIKRVLIIDDDADVAETLSGFIASRICQLITTEPPVVRIGEPLSAASINIVIATGYNEILRALEQHRELGINMLFTDFNMYKNLNGDEVVKKLRATGYSGFVFGITGRPDNRTAFYAAGTDLVLLKPVSLSVLDEFVR